MSNRHEFTAQTKKTVAARAGWRCSFAGCGKPTVGPSDESSEAVTMIGQAAHISGAAPGPGSRRYISSMTPQQRKSFDNAIWVCAIHAGIIDRDEVTYPIEVLRQMKLAHEAAQAKALVTAAADDMGAGLLAIGPEVIFMGDIQSISDESWTLRLKHFMVGDVHNLTAYIDQFPNTPAQDRYLLSNERGDGRVLSAPPRLMKEPDGYTLLCPVEHGCPRLDVQKLGSIIALHPETNDMYVNPKTGNIAYVAGVDALPQIIRTALSMQRGENVFAPGAGMRFFEFFEEYRGSPLLGWLLALDVVRQASIPVPNIGSDGQHTPLQCVTRVRSFDFLSEASENNRLPVRVDFEVQGLGRWQHDFSVYMPTKEQMDEQARLLAERPGLAYLART